MTLYPLTPEQEQVVNHPLGCHARVLAVAGSGKSTTLAHRIKYLVESYQISPTVMQVLMFNALARKQFIHHLDKVGLPQNFQPSVHTFHSFSFQVINEAIKANLLSAKTQFWLSDKAEYVWLTIKRVITDLEKAKRIAPDSIDPEQAMHAISLWKSSLIPPQYAGSSTQPHLPMIYAAFEEFRQSQAALTYDDFIPTAIDILENNAAFYRRFCGNIQHLIVDEYQDINLGQQTLIELLAADRADVMVVGDDDQTIYEWRGARPNYILQDFIKVFIAKAVKDYRLSRSFRFGPVIAQCAANVIACNTLRVDKPLVAFQAAKSGYIQVFQDGYNGIKELAEEVQTLKQVDAVPPKEIVVLSRMYAQMDNLEAEFLTRGIPYKVDGQEPFFKRKEVNTLLDYIRLANAFQDPMSNACGTWLLSIANKPSRMLSRSLLERLVSSARYKHLSVKDILEEAIYTKQHGLSVWQTRSLEELYDFLEELHERHTVSSAREFLTWMIDELGYLAYLEKYYGKGETSDEKAHVVTNFLKYVSLFEFSPLELLEHLEQLDTTQGRPDEELVLFTTIFRTKGLEFDYVIIPDCDENLLPYLKGERMDAFDKRGFHQENRMSTAIENERRLFYVGITRARKGVMIGTEGNPSRFLFEMQLAQTHEVMNVIQWLSAGDMQARSQLSSLLEVGIAQPAIYRNLVEGYLPDMGLSMPISSPISVLQPVEKEEWSE